MESEIPSSLFFVKKLVNALLVLILAFLVGCQKSEEESTKSADLDLVTVGMELSYPPFETIDERGRPVGVSVELARAFGEYSGRDVKIENIPFVGLIPALNSGRIDMVISSLTDTPERRDAIAFSEPYLRTGLAMLVAKDSTIDETYSNIDEEGRVFAVRPGTTGEVWARANLKNAKVLAVDKESAAVMEVIQGKADGFIYDQMSVWSNAQNHPDTTRALLAPIRQEEWAIGLRKGDEELLNQVNAFIKEFREQGGFNRLGDEFLHEQKTDFEKQGTPFFF